MPSYSDDGIVLLQHKLGEADQIITLLTKEHGKVRAVAKGVRRTRSKFGARLQTFNHVDLLLYQGRNLDTITQAVTLHAYPEQIGSDYGRFTAGKAIVELADKVVIEEKQPALSQFRLLLGALHALASGDRRPTLILDSYYLRAMAIAGYAPALAECALCGRPGPHEGFSPASGGIVCSGCRPEQCAFLDADTWRQLQALLAGDWGAATAADQADQDHASGLVAAFVNYHLDRKLKTLPHVDRG